MNVVKKIKDIILFTLGVIFFVVALFITILLLNRNDYGVTQLGSSSLIIINNDIASENYKKGDLVIVESNNRVEKYTEGKDIFTYRLDKDNNVNIEQGKIGKIYPEEDAIAFENGDAYSAKFIAGTPTKTYSGIGTPLSIVTSKWGFLFIILVPSFLIFIYEIYALILEIKYGKDEEEEEAISVKEKEDKPKDKPKTKPKQTKKKDN